MGQIRVLLAGESWATSSTHFKGWDYFTAGSYETGAEPWIKAVQAGGHIRVDFLPNHEALVKFPQTMSELESYDVVMLSDIGANTLLLHPDTFLRGKRTPNRLKLLKDWVAQGGSLIMVGGYLSFQGIQAMARYHGTVIEEILPVQISPYDDRVEVPEGFTPEAVLPDHPILEAIEGPWPFLLGMNQVTPKANGTVVLQGHGGPLLVIGEYQKGRTVAWTTDMGPHWCPNEFVHWEHFGRLWIQILEWCVRRR